MMYVPALTSLALTVFPGLRLPLEYPIPNLPWPCAVVDSGGFFGKCAGGLPAFSMTLRVCGVVFERLRIVTVVPGGKPSTCAFFVCVKPPTLPHFGSFFDP